MGIVDITGQKFGRLKVESFAYTKNNRAYWNCICDCGNHCVKMGKYLRNGDTKSCGCYNIERIREMGEANKTPNKYEILEDGKTVKAYFNNTSNYFLCDLDDWEPIEGFLTWFESEQGYARTYLSDEYGYMFFHSYVLNKKPNTKEVCDHINRNKLDNRKQNLRMVTYQENNINQHTYKNNKSGCTGVYYKNNKWISHIGYNHKNIYLGCFDSYKEAVEVRKQAELQYFGFLKEEGLASDNQYAEKLG